MISLRVFIFVAVLAVRVRSGSIVLDSQWFEQSNYQISKKALHHTGYRRDQVARYNMTLKFCEANFEDFDLESNIVCQYDVFPVDKKTTATLHSVQTTEDNLLRCTGDPPSLVYIANISDANNRVDVSIDKSKFNNTLDIEVYRFCIANNVVELFGDEYQSMFLSETVIDLNFVKDGGFIIGFDVNGVNMGGAGYDEGETNPGGAGVEDGNLGEGGAGTDREDEIFEVLAYQCDTDTYEANNQPIAQGNDVGICVETQDFNVLMNQIESLLLVQLRSADDSISSSPIQDFLTNAVTATRCDLANSDGQPNSKCFIRTSMLTKFFGEQVPMPVGAGGNAEILILNDGIARRALANINYNTEVAMKRSGHRSLQRPDTQLAQYTVLINLIDGGVASRSRTGGVSGNTKLTISSTIFYGVTLVWILLWF